MSKRYQVLARKYRPQSFRDVLAQDAAVTTLKNAIRFDKVAHAYLFCGSRGVGKTTLARLFAKALNCQSLTADFEPCNQCSSCHEISSGQSLDVIEIDGASNRGIDDIRQINETVGYAPSRGRYKIYIIDEVHMLTKEAFNALLKTLEEPPEQAKFFFATTEAHKVLPTIISRCQRFDLARIPPSLIVSKLGEIALDLNRMVDKEALELIAA
ncbi:MAG: DNA polymerase III subunit gamma/tau, partial [Verrucomicrobia bacterium]|nr:DNA polymerase III subunit gamma/tau [Verrucomicrobiota bacterium]